MLTSKILQTSELPRFLAFNRQNSGASVELTYLQRALIRVFFDDQSSDEWVATYVVNAQTPFRCLSVLSDEQREKQLAYHQLREDQIAEITLLRSCLS